MSSEPDEIDPGVVALIEAAEGEALAGLELSQAERTSVRAMLRARRQATAAGLVRDIDAWHNASVAARASVKRASRVGDGLVVAAVALWVAAALAFAFDLVSGTAMSAAIGVGFVVLAVGNAIRRAPGGDATLLHELERTSALLRQAITAEVKSTASAVANKVRRESVKRPLELATDRAPRLVELNAGDAIATETIERCVAFIRGHETSAIGLSGPRGVGKTTLMWQVCATDPDRYVGVYLAAPVSYAAKDFVRLVHAEVARAVLRSQGLDAEPRPRRPRTLTFRALGGMVMTVAGVLVVVLGRRVQPLRPTDALGGALAGAGLAVYVLSLSGVLLRGRRRADDVETLCRAELRRLAWSSRTESVAKNTFSFRGLTVADESSVELSERERSHPELVADFHAFTERLTRATGRSLVIAIDELDKLADAEHALAAVNGLKDLLHGPGTHVVVSVSEDALVSFALRGVPVRDAFDSSFDLVVPVERFSPENTVELMERRVLEFPVPLTLFCHAIGGGLPRDVIRHARSCIDVRRRRGHPVPITDVVPEVVLGYALTLLDALVVRQRTVDRTATAGLIEARRRVAAAAPARMRAALADAAARVRRAGVEGEVGEGLAVVLDAVADACGYFGARRSQRAWAAAITDGEAHRRAAALADVVAAVAVDAADAARRLAESPAPR